MTCGITEQWPTGMVAGRDSATALSDLPAAHGLVRQPDLVIEVLIIERDHLAAAHAGDRHQADQCRDGRPAQRCFQPVRLGELCGDVGGRIQVGHRAARPAGKQAGRGNLSGRVEGAQVVSEALLLCA